MAASAPGPPGGGNLFAARPAAHFVPASVHLQRSRDGMTVDIPGGAHGGALGIARCVSFVGTAGWDIIKE